MAKHGQDLPLEDDQDQDAKGNCRENDDVVLAYSFRVVILSVIARIWANGFSSQQVGARENDQSKENVKNQAQRQNSDELMANVFRNALSFSEITKNEDFICPVRNRQGKERDEVEHG